MSEKIRFAVIGCGHIGKRYIATIQDNSDAQLVTVADTGKSHNLILQDDVRIYDSTQQLLQSEPEVDIVVIATQNGLHFEQAVLVLQSGKHAVIEKPMTLCRNQAQELYLTARENNLHIFR